MIKYLSNKIHLLILKNIENYLKIFKFYNEEFMVAIIKEDEILTEEKMIKAFNMFDKVNLNIKINKYYILRMVMVLLQKMKF